MIECFHQLYCLMNMKIQDNILRKKDLNQQEILLADICKLRESQRWLAVF